MLYVIGFLVTVLLGLGVAAAIFFVKLYMEEQKRIAMWQAAQKLGKEIEE